ncbi:MAG: AAA family ATPase [Alphaproteobacteria bacterium]|nr:AAA family ATPase [Alphaproteobacteria bacterium]
MKDTNSDPSGSQWRKWDLHLHTPFTKLNDNYKCVQGGDIWTEYCEKIENSDVEVFGITDYFSVENYIIFKKKFQEAYPCSKKVFFPNIELRIDRSSNNRNEGYDLHLIFDNDLDDEKLTDFVRNLKLDNTDDNGKNVKASELSTEKDFKRAFTTITFINRALKDTFGDKKPYFKILMAHGHGGMQPEQGDSRKGAVAEETDKRVADIYFGCDEKDREFFLSNRNKVVKKKACISGSDAHSFENFDDKVGKTFLNEGTRKTYPTWIKADKTFEGLKQITHEPQERIFLGEKPDKLLDVEANRSRFIDFIKIGNKNAGNKTGWFYDSIPLNPSLVAIIGRKGQGKSALADIVGLCGKTKILPNDFSFLLKERFRKKGLAREYEATLQWVDGTAPIIQNLDLEVGAAEVEKVKYLPQKYVETICNEAGVSSQFQEEIDKVIFSYVPMEGRLSKNNLGDLISTKTSSIDSEIASFRRDLHAINDYIVKLECKQNPQYLEALKNKLEGKKQELGNLIKPKVVPVPASKPKQEEQDKLKQISNYIETVLSDIESASGSLRVVNEKIHKSNTIKATATCLNRDIENFIKRFTEDAKFLSVDLSKIISVKVDDKILDGLNQKLSLEKKDLEELLARDDILSKTSKSLYAKKFEAEKKKEVIVNALGEDQKKYSTYQQKLIEYEMRKVQIEGSTDDGTLETIKSIEKEIHYTDKDIHTDVQAKKMERDAIVDKLYFELQKKSDFYKEIYLPLQKFIESEKETQEKSGNLLGFDAGVIFDKGLFSSRFLWFINQGRDGSFQYIGEGQKVLDKIMDKADFSNPYGIKSFTQALIEHLEYNKTKDPEKENIIYSQLKGEEEDNIKFYDYVFGLEYLSVRYKVLFNDKDLNSNEFSPGEKGALLLIFYLLIDKDLVPLIMDQPEENLDNESIYELLVPYIKKAKLKRQVIIVTHNPNLAVVCDAEQIIEASMNKQKNQIRYAFGSIENPKMNKKVSDILEGTLPAFDIRDEKYIRA